jgi:hypothetical protein
MFDEIVEKYKNFSDALVVEVSYRAGERSKNVEIIIDCMNSQNEYKFDKIKLILIDVVSMSFIERENQSSTVVFSALLLKNEQMLTFDFFPFIYGEGRLEENENSDFKVKCRDAIYFKIQ